MTLVDLHVQYGLGGLNRFRGHDKVIPVHIDGHLEAVLAIKSSASKYYVNKIQIHGSSKQHKHFPDERNGDNICTNSIRILSCKERSGYGSEHFQTILSGKTIDVGFHLNKNKSHLLITFAFQEEDLDEKLTYLITECFPEYYIINEGVTVGVYRPRKGYCHRLNLSFELKIGDFLKHLGPYGDHEFYGKDMIAKDGFSVIASETLRSYGIPIENKLIPILTG